jgi:hypothetical protein
MAPDTRFMTVPFQCLPHQLQAAFRIGQIQEHAAQSVLWRCVVRVKGNGFLELQSRVIETAELHQQIPIIVGNYGVLRSLRYQHFKNGSGVFVSTFHTKRKRSEIENRDARLRGRQDGINQSQGCLALLLFQQIPNDGVFEILCFEFLKDIFGLHQYFCRMLSGWPVCCNVCSHSPCIVRVLFFQKLLRIRTGLRKIEWLRAKGNFNSP